MHVQDFTIVLYFFVYAFVGWVAEVLFHLVRYRHFVNRGFLSGPLCPIYGFGMVIIILVLDPYKHNLPLLFLYSSIFTSIIEWLTGETLWIVFKQKWWDYSNSLGHLGRFVCVPFSLLWGVLGSFVVAYVQPWLEFQTARISSPVLFVILVLLLAAFFIDAGFTIVRLVNFRHVLSTLEQKVAQLGLNGSPVTLQSTLDYLKQQIDLEKTQREVLERFERTQKRYRRLLQAFPTFEFLAFGSLIEALRQRRKDK